MRDGHDHHFGSRGAIHRAPTSAMAQTMIMAMRDERASGSERELSNISKRGKHGY